MDKAFSIGRTIWVTLGLVLAGALAETKAEAEPWPEWSTQGGQRIRAEMVQYAWAERSLMLRTGPDQEPLPVAAQDLDLRGKIRLLFAEPFQDCYLAHREELRILPAYRERLERLRQWGVILTGVIVAGSIACSWYLSGLALGKASVRFWFLILLAGLGLAAAGYQGVTWAIAEFGTEKAAEVVVLAVVAHSILLIFGVWAIYRCGFFRAFFWWALHGLILLLWPVLVVVAALASQVYLHARALSEPALDEYLSEVWLVPMGVI